MRTTNVPTDLAPPGTPMTAVDRPEMDLPQAVARRFEAIIFDWDGTAVPGRHSDASEVRGLVELLCGAGVDVAVVSGTHVDNVDGQLLARPKGPGRLLLALNRGSELFEVDQLGPRLLTRREATPQEDAALTRAARDTVEKLAARGFEARIVSQRLNRRKIDLLPEPEWADPHKSEIDRVVAAAEQRLRTAGIDGLVEAAQIALTAARDAGCVDPKITSDAKHVEIGLTDKSDSARAVLAELWADGISADQVLIAGDEFGPLGGLVGSDSMMLVAEADHATAFSVGVEPEGLPDRVVSLVYDDRTQHNFCVEIDRGHMPVKSKSLAGRTNYRRKLATYYHAHVQDCHKTQWGFQGFRILTIAPSEARIAHMLDAQREVTSDRLAGLFLYSTPQRLAEHGAFAPIWMTTERDGISIIDRS